MSKVDFLKITTEKNGHVIGTEVGTIKPYQVESLKCDDRSVFFVGKNLPASVYTALEKLADTGVPLRPDTLGFLNEANNVCILHGCKVTHSRPEQRVVFVAPVYGS